MPYRAVLNSCIEKGAWFAVDPTGAGHFIGLYLGEEVTQTSPGYNLNPPKIPRSLSALFNYILYNSHTRVVVVAWMSLLRYSVASWGTSQAGC